MQQVGGAGNKDGVRRTQADPVDALVAPARGHTLYCRRDVTNVLMTPRVEFAGQDHPVGRAITGIVDRLEADCARLIAAGRDSGAIPPGPPPTKTASALLGIVEAVGIHLTGRAPYDVELADRAVRGLLGLRPVTANSRSAGPSARTATQGNP